MTYRKLRDVAAWHKAHADRFSESARVIAQGNHVEATAARITAQQLEAEATFHRGVAAELDSLADGFEMLCAGAVRHGHSRPIVPRATPGRH